MSKNEVRPHNEINQDYAIVLPCQPQDFRDFISGLLGKPQTITKVIDGAFDLSKDDVINFHHLLIQRIVQQNENTLIQFTAKIIYDDDSAITLNNIDDFINYSEVRALISTSVHLSWIFLVKFQDKTIPEKQQIDVSINTSPRLILNRISRFLDLDSGYSFFVRINHTARTWGVDIESLLTGHIENLIKKTSPLKAFIKKHNGWIGLAVGITSFLASILICFYATNSFLTNQLDGLKSLQSSNEKLDYAINFMVAGVWSRFFFYIFFFLILTLIISILLGFWSGSRADIDEPSFLILSKKAQERKDSLLTKTKNQWLWFLVSIGVSILTGLIENVIFVVFLEKWANSLK